MAEDGMQAGVDDSAASLVLADSLHLRADVGHLVDHLPQGALLVEGLGGVDVGGQTVPCLLLGGVVLAYLVFVARRGVLPDGPRFLSEKTQKVGTHRVRSKEK